MRDVFRASGAEVKRLKAVRFIGGDIDDMGRFYSHKRYRPRLTDAIVAIVFVLSIIIAWIAMSVRASHAAESPSQYDAMRLVSAPVINSTGRPSCCPPRAWCSCQMSVWVYHACKPELFAARSWLNKGREAQAGCINCIAILSRGPRGGHVGFVRGYDHGNPILESGNHNNRVGIGTYPASRVLGYRWI